MHTRLDIQLNGKPKQVLEAVIDGIKDTLFSAEMLLSCHHPEALAAKLNHYDSDSHLVIPNEFYDVLKYAKSYYHKSGKLFDVTLGSGRFIFEEALDRFPENIKQHTSTPFHLDFGGFGKGYALKKIKSILEAAEITNAFLSFGGTSVLGMGVKQNRAWKYALPEFPHITFQLKDEAISISSNANPKGESNHIIYPDTFKPADTNFVVAVKCKDALDAEILSTSLILAEMKNYQKLLNTFPNSEAYIIDKIEPQQFLYLQSV